MTLSEALRTVLELAEQNVLDDPSPEMRDEVRRQERALKIVNKVYKALPKEND